MTINPGVVRTDLLMAAAWAINLGIAEWLIRRPSTTYAPVPQCPCRRRHRTPLTRRIAPAPRTAQAPATA